MCISESVTYEKTEIYGNRIWQNICGALRFVTLIMNWAFGTFPATYS